MMQDKGNSVRILICSALLIVTASCAWPPPPPGPPAAPEPWFYAPLGLLFTPLNPTSPGRLTLSNFSFDSAHVETVVTASPDCAATEGTAPSDFVLPLNATRVIETAPGSDVCWRRAIEAETAPGRAPPPPKWTEWNRAFLSSGRSIDAQL